MQVRNKDGYLGSIHRLYPTRLLCFFLIAFGVDRAVSQLRSSCSVGASCWPVSTVDALVRSMYSKPVSAGAEYKIAGSDAAFRTFSYVRTSFTLQLLITITAIDRLLFLQSQGFMYNTSLMKRLFWLLFFCGGRKFLSV